LEPFTKSDQDLARLIENSIIFTISSWLFTLKVFYLIKGGLMKRNTVWIVLTCLILTSVLLASCTTSTSTTSTTQTTTSTTIVTSTSSKTTSTTLATTKPTTISSALTGNWWDKLGKPQYGGTMSLRINKDEVNFDPYNAQTLTSVETAWLERLFTDDWTMDPSVWSYQLLFRPTEYAKGFLADT
jgi:hypothetical protein